MVIYPDWFFKIHILCCWNMDQVNSLRSGSARPVRTTNQKGVAILVVHYYNHHLTMLSIIIITIIYKPIINYIIMDNYGFHKPYIDWIPPFRPAQRFPLLRFRARFLRMSWNMTWKLWRDDGMQFTSDFMTQTVGTHNFLVDSVWKPMTICLGFRFLDAPAKTKKARSSFKPLMLCQGVYDGEKHMHDKKKSKHIKTYQHWTL